MYAFTHSLTCQLIAVFMLASLMLQVRRMSHGSQQDQFLLGSYSASPWSSSGSAMLALKPKPQHNKLSIGLLKASNTTGGSFPHACSIVPLAACRTRLFNCQLPESSLSVHLSASRNLSVCATVSFQDLVYQSTLACVHSYALHAAVPSACCRSFW